MRHLWIWIIRGKLLCIANEESSRVGLAACRGPGTGNRDTGDRGDPFASTLSASRRVETLVHRLENFLQKCVEPSRHAPSTRTPPKHTTPPLDRSLRPPRLSLRNETGKPIRCNTVSTYEDHVDRNEAGGRAGIRAECHNFEGGLESWQAR